MSKVDLDISNLPDTTVSVRDVFRIDTDLRVLLPKGTPDEVVTILEDALRTVVEGDSFADWAKSNSAIVQFEDSATLTKKLKADYERYEAIISDLRI